MKRGTVVFAWVALGAAVALGAPAKAGDAKAGKAVFGQCGICHSADTNDKKMGPSLKGLFKKAKMTDGQKVTEATVRAKIDNGGNGMPAYKEMLNEKERNDLIAYLKTL